MTGPSGRNTRWRPQRVNKRDCCSRPPAKGQMSVVYEEKPLYKAIAPPHQASTTVSSARSRHRQSRFETLSCPKLPQNIGGTTEHVLENFLFIFLSSAAVLLRTIDFQEQSFRIPLFPLSRFHCLFDNDDRALAPYTSQSVPSIIRMPCRLTNIPLP